ncbi:hypothetical protein CFP56_022126 [Quercus suber]|uniref:Uncharacterized protein n=1 Tax=Quercus suber TaxID=58331 RepID=A0AAW0M1M2_QUESU
MCSRWWYSSPFRWPEFTLPMPISSIFRWPGINLSYFTTGWSIGSFISFRWLDFTIFDDVFWTIVMMLESVALVAMLYNIPASFIGRQEFLTSYAKLVDKCFTIGKLRKLAEKRHKQQPLSRIC